MEAAASVLSVWWSVTRSSGLLPSNAKPGESSPVPLPPLRPSHSSLVSLPTPPHPPPHSARYSLSSSSLSPFLLSLFIPTCLLSPLPPYCFYPLHFFLSFCFCKNVNSSNLREFLSASSQKLSPFEPSKLWPRRRGLIHQHKSPHLPVEKENPSKKMPRYICCSLVQSRFPALSRLVNDLYRDAVS